YLGAVWIIIAVSTLMVILVEGGVSLQGLSKNMFLIMSVSLSAFILFFIQQKRAVEPMMPLGIWRFRLIAFANITSLTTGMITIGVSSYLPAFVQGVMGQTATIAGFTLTTMSIGWPLASIVAGRTLLVIGYRATAWIGGIALIVGTLFFF